MKLLSPLYVEYIPTTFLWEGCHMTLVEIIIFLSILVLFSILTLVLLQGKGAFLISGYNTMGAEEKAKYDTVALCKATGKIMAGVTFTLFLQFSGELFQLKWLSIGSIILMFVILIGAIRYMYTGNRFLIRTK